MKIKSYLNLVFYVVGVIIIVPIFSSSTTPYNRQESNTYALKR